MNETSMEPTTLIFILVLIVCVFAGFLTMLPGFVLFALGKKEIGEKLVKFGAGCGVIAFSSALAVAAIIQRSYLPLVILAILVGYWIIWAKMKKHKISQCPHCGEQIKGEEKRKLSWSFKSQRPIPCQSCGTNIVLSKWPWLLMSIGCYLFLSLFLLKLFKVGPDRFWDVVFYVPVVLFLIGNFTMKLEVFDSKEHT